MQCSEWKFPGKASRVGYVLAESYKMNFIWSEKGKLKKASRPTERHQDRYAGEVGNDSQFGRIGCKV